LAFQDAPLDIYGIPVEERLAFRLSITLSMLHTGLRTLTCYSPELVQWKQAHAQANFAILRAVLMWGRGAAIVKAVDGSFKLYVDPDNLDGVVDAVELLLKHLNYYKAARQPEQAKEFFGALTSFDDFWLAVAAKSRELKVAPSIHCGAAIKKSGDRYTLARAGEGTSTILDVAKSVLGNITLASAV
jgi:dipeptidyl-peptidase-3